MMTVTGTSCADCGTVIGKDKGPSGGWQLEDGRTVCNQCCITDTQSMAHEFIAAHKQLMENSIITMSLY